MAGDDLVQERDESITSLLNTEYVEEELHKSRGVLGHPLEASESFASSDPAALRPKYGCRRIASYISDGFLENPVGFSFLATVVKGFENLAEYSPVFLGFHTKSG